MSENLTTELKPVITINPVAQEHLINTLQQLADKARDGSLVYFTGFGFSDGADFILTQGGPLPVSYFEMLGAFEETKDQFKLQFERAPKAPTNT